MAITQVGTATSGSSATSGSFSVTKPTGVQSGDVLFVVGASNEGAWDTLPSGFTQQYQSTDGNTPNNFRVYVWTKVCGGSEPSSYSFGSTTASGAGAPMVAIISAWRGVDNTTPILHFSNADSGASSEPADPAISFTQTGDGRVVFARSARSTTDIPTFSTATSGWSELADAGEFSGGSVRYGIGLYAKTADTSSGSQTEPAVSCSTTETDNVYNLWCLKAEIPPVNAPATVASATATAYAPASLTASTTSAYSAVTATAHNPSVLTGVAAENVPAASAVATAYDAMGWVIHPVDVGAVAFDATVAIGTQATHAAVSVGVSDAVGYYGAPESRRWRIPAEDRSWTIAAESRAWTIPSED